MSLQKKAKSSIIWTLLEALFVKGFTLFITIILARLLTPEDFGLMGLMTVFITIATVVVESGLGTSIIRDNNADSVDFSTVFFGNLALSLFVYPIIFFLAPFIATYFEQPILSILIRVYSISIIISAFYSIQEKLLMKELAFKELTILSFPGVLLGAVIAIIMAYYGCGVWSIIGMQLSTQTIKALVIWFKSTWRPSWLFSVEKLKFHFNFGYKLVISSIIKTLVNELYTVVIGKQFSIQTLGLYTQAKNMRSYPVTLLSGIISKVTYPLLSKIKEDNEKISKIYQSILRSVFFVITPLMLGMMVVAKPLFLILFSEKWVGVVPYFQILAVSSILTPIHEFNINVFNIYGRSDLFLKLEIIKVVMIFIAVLCGIYFGIYGLLWSIVISSYVGLFVNTHYSGNLISYKTIHQLKDMLPIFIIGFLASAAGYFVLKTLSHFNNVFQLVITLFVFLVVYFGVNILTKNKSMLEVIQFTKIFIKK